MFERYSEDARRAVFFAREAVSQFGGSTIEAEHLLIGLMREADDTLRRLIGDSFASISKGIEERTAHGEMMPTSASMPLSNECKRILAYAAEEAERLNQRPIDRQHVLLGILREEGCVAAAILKEHGLRLDTAREQLRAG